MGKILVIAEKPSVGRELAKILKCNRRGDGCLIGETHIVTWAIGHLVELCEPSDYNPRFKHWSFRDLPILPNKISLKPVESTRRQFDVVAGLMKDESVESLICATDSGREGELIFRYIYVAESCHKPFKRLWISSMTTQAIEKGFANMKDGKDYDNLYYSAKCRSEADWLVGINATRAFTIQYDSLLTIGRVQTPTLALIVNRQAEIDDFKSQDYWEVQAEFEDYLGKWFNKVDNEPKISRQSDAETIVEKIRGKIATVIDVDKEKKATPAPLLYDLTELQRDANKKYGLTAQETLSLAQELYERYKLITYPRTDSRYLSNDMKDTVKTTLQKLAVPPYKDYVDYVLKQDKISFSKRIIDDKKITDHHAIIPTETTPNIGNLPTKARDIYHLIAKRFICVFYPKFEFSITRITTVVENEHFLSRGKMIIKWGWMEFYKSDTRSKNEDQQLPELKKSDTRQVTAVELLTKKTKPPKPYNEASLLSAMENAGRFVEDEELKEQLKENGLGTPATRASVIERLLKVSYIKRNKKNLIPTPKGKKLIAIVPSAMKSPEFTGKWERGLSKINKGELDPKLFMDGITNYVKKAVAISAYKNSDVVFESQKDRRRLPEDTKVFGSCPACKQGQILENSKSYYCSDWRKGCRFSLWKNSLDKYGVNLTAEMATKLISGTAIENQQVTLESGSAKGIADIIINNRGYVNLRHFKKNDTIDSTKTESTKDVELDK